MRYVIKRVRDWKNMRLKRDLNTFQLDESDQTLYSNRLFGFSHGTGKGGFEKILQGGSIKSSFNIRVAQRAVNRHLTGGDQGHDGQYTVYFRFVEKKNSGTDTIPTAIVRSLGGVGGGSGYVFFVSLNKIVQSGACFALASGVDGMNGASCFTDKKLQQAGRAYGKNFDPVIFGRRQFELGLEAAEAESRGNEIGFYNSVSLDNVEIIMIRGLKKRTIPNYSFVMNYKIRNDSTMWKVYLRNGSTLNIGQQESRISQAAQISQVSQISQASRISQPTQPAQQPLQIQ